MVQHRPGNVQAVLAIAVGGEFGDAVSESVGVANSFAFDDLDGQLMR